MKPQVLRARIVRLLVLLATMTVASIAMTAVIDAPAGASPVPAQRLVAPAGTATCPTYPFGPGPSVSISTTDPFPGETVTIRGANFDKNAHVSIVMSPPGTTLASVTTSASGSFTAHVTIPAATSGTATISIVGGAPADCLPNTIVIHIQPPAGPPPGGNLSNTGVDILLGLLVALALLCAGLFLTRTGRRRHRPAHSAR